MKSSKINREWHMKNKMPKNATFEQRVKWHREHNKHCACRPGFPEKLKEEMKKRGMKLNENPQSKTKRRNENTKTVQ